VLIACGLLAVGLLMRARLRVVQWIFLPASVVGGLVGLVLIQVSRHIGDDSETEIVDGPLTTFVDGVASDLRSWPSLLIAVVFAGLLMETKQSRSGRVVAGVSLAAMMVWIIVLGEVAVGLAVTWLFILPVHDVPHSFGQLLEAGFAGGHGTAGALGEIFSDVLDFPAGRDLGFFMATVGLVYGVVSGIIFVNIGLRRGWTRGGHAELELVSGLEKEPRPIAYGRVRSDVLDPLALQLVLVAIAFAIGLALQEVVIQMLGLVLTDETMRFIERAPLFLFTLIGGWMLHRGLAVIGADGLIDNDSVKRIVAVAMDFLIVAAIASLKLDTLTTYLGPITVLLVAGALWTGICLLLLSPRVLSRSYWFELGILNYGMSTGTTAQGMMLLRIVDRDLESGAAEDYAMAAPFSAPFIGGGIITLSMPLLLERVHIGLVVVGLTVVVVTIFVAARGLRRRVTSPGS
jgi:ESS family glutamate:Na+ symporter